MQTSTSNLKRIGQPLRTENLVQTITYLFIIIHFALNFLGSPIIKYFYAAEVLFFAFCIAYFPLQKSMIAIIALLFIEGQGRVIWSYHPIMRVVFDGLIAVAAIKSYAINRVVLSKKIPTAITFAIILHFFWYGLQIFNINNLGWFAVVAASKIYIFPFVVFLTLLQNPINYDEEMTEKIQNITILITLLAAILCAFQMSQGEQFMIDMAPYYEVTLKGDTFTDDNFRPHGTSFEPGGMSVYFYLTVGFLFLAPIKSITKSLSLYICIGATWGAMFISQVRSAMIKHAMIVLAMGVIGILINRFKVKPVIKQVIALSIVLVLAIPFADYEKMFPDIDFSKAIDRFSLFTESEGDVSEFRAGRAGMDLMIREIAKHITETPLGLGPGRTGAAASVAAHRLHGDPLYNLAYGWHYDNLFLSLVIDLGVGMIFYTFTILALPLLIGSRALKCIIDKNWQGARPLIISFLCSGIILFGNMAAVGLPYNPESFVFWFWVAFGINASARVQELAEAKIVDKNSEQKNQEEKKHQNIEDLDENSILGPG